ncbi:MAG: PDZ domain-containing protein [Planctomycetaceae bacterium]|nr:PDZ domain-containing protein [Planctomycetaceae bacterium]
MPLLRMVHWHRAVVSITVMLMASTLVADERLEALEEQAFREAAALAEPSIVRIETVGGLDVLDGLITPSGPTTGVVVGADGWIITSSFNFASRPASILVTTPDGTRRAASVAATDEARMLTLLKVDASRLTPLAAAPLEEMRVGQWAIALGRTFDQPFPSISVGIVSALGRIWGRAIQTDAKTSPTNYGGPLLDVQGRALGIIVPLDPQKTDATAGVEWYDSGIGFAIPMEDIYAVLSRMQAGEQLKPGRMGLTFKDLGPTAGEPIVDRVRAGSPAYDAGLRAGDRITAVDGRVVSRVPHVRHLLGRKYAGDAIALTYMRDGSESAAQMTLVATLEPYEAPLLGILPERVPWAERTGETTGAGVRFVLPDSPAARSGIVRRDVVTKVDGDQIVDAAALRDAVSRHRPGDTVEIGIVRGGREETISVKLTAMSANVPADLPTEAVPAREPAAGEGAPKTGRWVDNLGGDPERSYWAYVPADYDPALPAGLVVWLHPAGDTMEADILRKWQAACDRRGIILVGPKTAQPSGWKPGDIAFVTDLVQELRERYAVDPLRIVVHAYGDAAPMASAVVFRNRETFRGLSLVGASLRAAPPESTPEFSLQFHILCGGNDPEREAAQKSAEALEELRFPVLFQRVEELGHEYPSAEALGGIAAWVDALDRI